MSPLVPATHILFSPPPFPFLAPSLLYPFIVGHSFYHKGRKTIAKKEKAPENQLWVYWREVALNEQDVYQAPKELEFFERKLLNYWFSQIWNKPKKPHGNPHFHLLQNKCCVPGISSPSSQCNIPQCSSTALFLQEASFQFSFPNLQSPGPVPQDHFLSHNHFSRDQHFI